MAAERDGGAGRSEEHKPGDAHRNALIADLTALRIAVCGSRRVRRAANPKRGGGLIKEPARKTDGGNGAADKGSKPA